MSAPRRAFGVINANIMRSPSVSTTAKTLYALLATYADPDGVCWPSNDTLATSLGVSLSTIHRGLSELQDKGVIERTERRRETGSQTTSVNVLIDWSSVRGGVTSDTPARVTSDTPMNKTNEQDHSLARQEPGEKKKIAQSTEPEGFKAWWNLYPKKSGKQAALRAYVKAVKTTDESCLMVGLTQQVDVLSAKQDEGFCPDPATWINAGRWDDEVTPRQKPLGRDDPKQPWETRDQWLVRAGFA